MVHRCVVHSVLSVCVGVECVCLWGGDERGVLLTRTLAETVLWEKPIAPEKQYLETLSLAGASQFSTGGCSVSVRAGSIPTLVPKSVWPSVASTV